MYTIRYNCNILQHTTSKYLTLLWLGRHGSHSYKVTQTYRLSRTSAKTRGKRDTRLTIHTASVVLRYSLSAQLHSQVEIFTPSDPAQRGCQLSLKFLHSSVETVYERLKTLGIVCDVRKPDVMRVAPAPLYNSFMDVFEFVSALKMILLTA
jgi:hypothetical protein